MIRDINRRFALIAGVCLAVLAGGCSNPPQFITPDTTPLTTVTETFTGDLTVNGAATHPFPANQAGLTSAAISALSPDPAAVIGLSLGTWNGQVCQIILANDNATQGASIIGEARQVGNFCVRVYDVGKLAAPTSYVLTVTHY